METSIMETVFFVMAVTVYFMFMLIGFMAALFGRNSKKKLHQ